MRNTWRMGGRPVDEEVVEVDSDVAGVDGDVRWSVVAVEDEPDEQAAAMHATVATRIAAVAVRLRAGWAGIAG
jgi:hypothetical protein